MKRICTLIFVLISVLGLFSSCNPEVKGSGEGGKPKVYYIGVGLQYDVPISSEDGNNYYLGIMDDNENSAEAGFLAGTVNDIAEFSTAYGILLNKNDIEYEPYFFLQQGTPWYSGIEYSYLIKPYGQGYSTKVDSFTIDGVKPSPAALESVKSAYASWLEENPYAPTKSNILNLIKTTLKEKVKEGDLVVFMYSGHGLRGSGAMNVLPEGFCPFMNTKAMREGAGSTTFLPSELYEALNCLPCKKVVFFDSCYSGNAISAFQKEHYETGMMDFLGPDAFESIDVRKGLLSSKADFDDFSILAATDFGHSSYDSVKIKTTEYFEGHGQMMAILLESLGWNHSKDVYSVLSKDNLATANDITIHGSSSEKVAFDGPVTVDSLYSYVKPIQDEAIGYKYKLSMTSGSTTVCLIPKVF